MSYWSLHDVRGVVHRPCKKSYLWAVHNIASLCSISNGSPGKNSVTKFICKVGQIGHQSFSVTLVFCTKLYRKLAVSQTVFLVPSQELISRLDSWKGPKFDTIARHYLISKMVLGDFDIRSSSHFLMTFLQIFTRFCKHQLLRATSWKWNKNQISLAPFCRPRLPLHVSNIKTCPQCSRIEVNSSADTVFSGLSEILRDIFFISYVIRFAFQIAFRQKNASKSVHKRLKSPIGLTVTS